MPHTKANHSRRFGVEYEEEKAWISFYRNVDNPNIANEVIAQLESDPELKRKHLALYLKGKETLRQQKARKARNNRIGQFVRMLSTAFFVKPVIAIQKMLRQSGEIAVACLPDVDKEPAVRQVNQLAQDPEFAQAKSAFGSSAASQFSQQSNVEENTQAASTVVTVTSGRSTA